MFTVSKIDRRLKNKAEVLVMRLETAAAGGGVVPVAISSDFLKKRPLYQTELAGRQLVVVTSRGGANRVYEAGHRRFVRAETDGRVVDDRGVPWVATEDALVAERPTGERLQRVSAQRAFWFGWHAQFPDTLLIK